MKQLKAMRWHLLIVGQGLVLGDSVVFAELANGSFKPVSEPGDALKRVWIPIAHDRVLAGSESDEAIPHDTLFINQGAASCSFDSFCSREGPPKHKSLIPLVRTATFSLDEAQSEIIMKELLAKAMF